MIAATLLIAMGVYLLCGLVFALPFVLVGVARIDPHAAHGSWGFRVLIIPGTMFLWPLLAGRWLKGIHEPPEENTPHRCAAKRSADLQSAVSQVSNLQRFDHSDASANIHGQPTASRRYGSLKSCATKECSP
jgi:hypothetical protein